MDEQIIVVPRDKLFENETLFFQGAVSDQEKIEKLFDNIFSNFSVMRRGDAEENYEYKQPIPYLIIKKGNQVFLYKRLEKSGESRLHDKLSIGIGGHMNNTNQETFEDILKENLYRELEEEVYIKSNQQTLKKFGLINYDDDDVSKVHICILYILELDENSEVETRETEQIKGEWIEINKLKNSEEYDKLENWSKIAVDIL